MKVYVVDNGGQWTHREWRVLKYLDVDTKIIPNTLSVTELLKLDLDGLVLSGGAPRIGGDAFKLGNTAAYLDKIDLPILGICVAHQFTAVHYGGSAGPAVTPEFGKTELIVDDENELFAGLPNRFQVWESHNDEIKTLPPVLMALAHSEHCRYQAIRHVEKPIYGVQFHPEVEHTDHGYDIFKNFLRLCDNHRR
jgi:GMP synthase (glutamine-hydrolysing)